MSDVIGTIAGTSLAIARLEGDYVLIPCNQSDPLDESEVVRVHVSDVPGLAGTLQALRLGWVDSRGLQGAGDRLRAMAIDAGLERGVTPR